MKYRYLVLAGLCTLLGTVCSCSTEEAAAQILGSGSKMPGSSAHAPVFIACKAVSEGEIDFEFSLPVRVTSIEFSPALVIGEIEEGTTVRVHFSGGPKPGEKLTAELLAVDERGNTISVLVPLRTKNSRIPSLQINELRTEYSKPKAEFIELKTVTAGNLGALRVFITGNTKSPLVYEFPPVETKAGEYIVLHLRTMEEAVRDELGDNLNESGGTDSSPDARDIWIAGTEKLLHKTDAVYVLDQDDAVIDAVMLAESPDSWWSKDYFAEAAEFLFNTDKAWKSAKNAPAICSPAEAVASGKTTNTRTICRDETVDDTNTAGDWYITNTSCATPGKPNNPKRYVEK